MFPSKYKHSVSLERANEKNGSVDLQTSQRGRKATLTEKDLHEIDQLIIAQPDITIDEIIENLGVTVSKPLAKIK